MTLRCVIDGEGDKSGKAASAPLEKEESVQEQKDLGIKGWIKGKK